MAKAKQRVKRFDLSERIEHLGLLITFVVLAITGLPQKYASSDWGEWAIAVMGGVESVRIIHRISATLLMALAMYHGGILTYKLLVLRRPASMMPGLKDGRDLLQHMAYNLGLSKQHPRMGRFNYEEKLEYWSVVWGTVIMVVTGFMLWNPIATARFLPGEVIPAAKMAHGGEALLAVLAIIIWHMYNVLVNWNFSIFTGWIRRETMEEKHALELEEIDAGNMPQPPPLDIYRRRMRWFLPWATIMTILLLTFLVWFVTFEQTAIDTLPLN